jgi:hypothetical protein
VAGISREQQSERIRESERHSERRRRRHALGERLRLATILVAFLAG